MSENSGWQVPDSAPRHYHDQVGRFMGPFAEVLVESAVSSGEAVLDVACGTGMAARAAARVAGAAGRVVGSDINSAMLQVAAEVSDSLGDGIEWQEASALDLPYGDEVFDSVICQQGVQFFPDPASGLREMARVARDGGMVAVTVWSALVDSPYLEAMYYMLMEYFDANEDELAWSSSAEQITNWFLASGLGRPNITQVERSVSLPPLHIYVPAHMKATPWAEEFDALSSDETDHAIDYMAHRLASWQTESGITAPFASFVATAVHTPGT